MIDVSFANSFLLRRLMLYTNGAKILMPVIVRQQMKNVDDLWLDRHDYFCCFSFGRRGERSDASACGISRILEQDFKCVKIYIARSGKSRLFIDNASHAYFITNSAFEFKDIMGSILMLF